MNPPMFNLEIKRNRKRGIAAWLPILLVTLMVLALLTLLIGLRDGVEGAMVSLTHLLPVSYAFAAGMVASVNPCGILMLPSYSLYQLGSEETAAPRHPVRMVLRALRLTMAITAGFTAIFGLVGAVIAAGGRWLLTLFPFAGLLIGAAMLGLGLWLLKSHRNLGIAAAGRLRVTPQRNLGNMFLFGVVYAIGSLSCTLPIFLVVVGSALSSGSFAASIGQFLGYALGMGSVILAVTVGAGLFQRAISRWLERVTVYVHRFGSLFLIGAGGYLLFYWIFIVGVF